MAEAVKSVYVRCPHCWYLNNIAEGSSSICSSPIGCGKRIYSFAKDTVICTVCDCFVSIPENTKIKCSCGSTLSKQAKQPETVQPDEINRPAHYKHCKFEAVDVIRDWDLGFLLGNTLKYINRHMHKGTPLKDLRKAAWYLNRAIEGMEKEQGEKT